MDKNNTIWNIAFFIQLRNKLPSWYPQLSEELTFYNIKLIPIRASQLMDLMKRNEKVQLIVGTLDLEGQRRFEKILKGAILFGLRNRRFTIHHISSFSVLTSLNIYLKNKFYFQYELPDSFKNLAKKIQANYNQCININEKWPGGRRAGFLE